MVQAEVADRLVAVPGSRVYGVPSVKTAWWAEATRAGSVAANGVLARAQRRLGARAAGPAPAAADVGDPVGGLRPRGRGVRAAPEVAAGGAERVGGFGRRRRGGPARRRDRPGHARGVAGRGGLRPAGRAPVAPYDRRPCRRAKRADAAAAWPSACRRRSTSTSAWDRCARTASTSWSRSIHAVSLYDEVVVEAADRLSVGVVGEGADVVPLDGDNLAVRAVRARRGRRAARARRRHHGAQGHPGRRRAGRWQRRCGRCARRSRRAVGRRHRPGDDGRAGRGARQRRRVPRSTAAPPSAPAAASDLAGAGDGRLPLGPRDRRRGAVDPGDLRRPRRDACRRGRRGAHRRPRRGARRPAGRATRSLSAARLPTTCSLPRCGPGRSCSACSTWARSWAPWAGIVSGSGPTVALLARSADESVAIASALPGFGVCRTVRRAHGPVPGARALPPGDPSA